MFTATLCSHGCHRKQVRQPFPLRVIDSLTCLHLSEFEAYLLSGSLLFMAALLHCSLQGVMDMSFSFVQLHATLRCCCPRCQASTAFHGACLAVWTRSSRPVRYLSYLTAPTQTLALKPTFRQNSVACAGVCYVAHGHAVSYCSHDATKLVSPVFQLVAFRLLPGAGMIIELFEASLRFGVSPITEPLLCAVGAKSVEIWSLTQV